MKEYADELAKADAQTIAVCYPGEHFSSAWVTGFLQLYCHLLSNRFRVQLCPCYTSNVYHTRMQLTEMLIREGDKPDLVLWIDDDNIATPQDFDRLYQGLQRFPDVDVMAGWCWIHWTQTNMMIPSCGPMHGEQQMAMNGAEWVKVEDVTFIDWTGFPFVLMRYAALEKAGGKKAWLPIIDERYQVMGMTGEDISWSIHAKENGVKMAADPRVRVEHIKPMAIAPFIPESSPVAEEKDDMLAGMAC
jgi:hypothetical protein